MLKTATEFARYSQVEACQKEEKEERRDLEYFSTVKVKCYIKCLMTDITGKANTKIPVEQNSSKRSHHLKHNYPINLRMNNITRAVHTLIFRKRMKRGNNPL